MEKNGEKLGVRRHGAKRTLEGTWELPRELQSSDNHGCTVATARKSIISATSLSAPCPGCRPSRICPACCKDQPYVMTPLTPHRALEALTGSQKAISGVPFRTKNCGPSNRLDLRRVKVHLHFIQEFSRRATY